MSGQRRIFTCKTVLVILVCSLILGMMVSVVPWLQPNGGLWQDINWANLPPYTQEQVPGLDGEVHIVRDYWGVPHIFATSTEDLYFACGYAHAQDRLFQLDLYRRIAKGKLAELFGSEYIDFDQYNRQLGFDQAALNSLSVLDPAVLALLDSYAAGINQYMVTIGNKVPLEIRVLNYFPSSWSAVDSLSIERYLAWQLSASSAFQDLQMASLVDTYGANLVFQDLFPEIQYDDKFIIPSPSTYPKEITQAASALATYFQEVESRSPILFDNNGGSNCWVLNESRTATGGPLLASDPHLSLTVPPLWYEIHLIGPSTNVQGVTYPGIPFVYQGHNEDIAWGWTGMKTDVSDFYYYVWHPSQPNQYWWNGGWNMVEERNTTLIVRVDVQLIPVEVTLNYSVHGPLFEEGPERFALKWTGANSSRTPEALYEVSLASDYASFLTAIDQIECPNLNFLYADTSGNIAYHASGAHPLRGPGLGPAPLNGSSGTEEWMGFIPFASLPNILNPSTGFLVTANNRPINSSYPYYLGYDFDAAHRANRITDLLNTSNSHTLTDMQRIQLDSLSLHALAIKDIVANVVLNDVSESENPTMYNAANTLLIWDGIMSTESVAATIWASFSPTFMNATFYDEYLFAGTPEGPYPSVTVLENFTQTDYGRWFNNVFLPGNQTRDDIILASFEDTIEFLSQNLGPDTTLWNYQVIHVLWIQHPMAESFPYLNPPRFPVNGSEYTVNYAPGYLVAIGQSYRLLIDVADFDNSLAVLPAGQRANGYSAHYLDQLGLYVMGDYHPLPFPGTINEMTEYHSIFHLIPG